MVAVMAIGLFWGEVVWGSYAMLSSDGAHDLHHRAEESSDDIHRLLVT